MKKNIYESKNKEGEFIVDNKLELKKEGAFIEKKYSYKNQDAEKFIQNNENNIFQKKYEEGLNGIGFEKDNGYFIENNNISINKNKEDKGNNIINNSNQNKGDFEENEENRSIFLDKNKFQKKININYIENVNSFQILNDGLSIRENKPKKYHCIKTLIGHTDYVVCLIQLKSGLIATGSKDSTICIWDLEKGTCDKKLNDLGKVFCLLEFEPDMILSGNEFNINLWDLKSKKEDYLYNFLEYEQRFNCLVKCNDNIFASGSNDGKIDIWDYYNKVEIRKINAHEESILCLIKLNDGNLCSGSEDKKIKIFNWEKGTCINELLGHNNWVKSICQLDDNIIVSGSDDYSIKIWKNFKEKNSIIAHTDSVRTLCKIDEKYFASGSFDGTIKIWDSKKLECYQILSEHKSNVINIIKLKNNNLASCSNDKTIKIWEQI